MNHDMQTVTPPCSSPAAQARLRREGFVVPSRPITTWLWKAFQYFASIDSNCSAVLHIKFFIIRHVFTPLSSSVRLPSGVSDALTMLDLCSITLYVHSHQKRICW